MIKKDNVTFRFLFKPQWSVLLNVSLVKTRKNNKLLEKISSIETHSQFFPLLITQDAMKEYLEKKERGELAAQKVDFLKENILRTVGPKCFTNIYIY